MSSRQGNTTTRIAIAAAVVLVIVVGYFLVSPGGPPTARNATKERQKLIAGLSAGAPEVRASAAARLGKHRPVARETVAALAGALSDPDAIVQANAARALAEIGPLLTDRPEWVELAIGPATDGLDDSARIALPLAEFLSYTGSAGKPAIPRLRAFITYPGMKQRIAAIHALIKLDPEHGEDLLPGLTGLLNEADPQSRSDALVLLARIGDKGKPAVPKVIALIDGDPEPSVRVEAATTLLAISPADGSRAVPGLVALIKEIDGKTGGKLKSPGGTRSPSGRLTADPAVLGHPLLPARAGARAILLKLDPKAAEAVNQ